MDVAPAIPGRDGAPERLQTAVSGVSIGEFHLVYVDPSEYPATSVPGDRAVWPGLRGVGSDNVVEDGPPLRSSWNGDLEILWSVTLGEGHAAPAVAHGRVYLLDYDEENRADALRCFALVDGTELWRTWYRNDLKRNHGISRTVPAVGAGYVVTMGPACHVMCVDAFTGEFNWGIDLPMTYGTEVPLWYTGQCPLIDGETAVLAPGGDSLMIGVRIDDGETVWEVPNPEGWQMSHSSILKAVVVGVEMYVYRAVGGIIGISAEPDSKGQVLWEFPDPTTKVIAPSPVVVGDGTDGHIFFSAGYGVGSLLLRIIEDGGSSARFTAAEVYSHPPGDALSCEQQTPVYYDGSLYGVMSEDGGELRSQMVRFDPLTDRFVWMSGKENRFGLGPFCVADGKLYILNDRGRLTVADAGAEAWTPLGGVQVLDGVDAWGPIAIAGSRMLMRDSRTMVCIDVGVSEPTANAVGADGRTDLSCGAAVHGYSAISVATLDGVAREGKRAAGGF